MYGSNDNLEDLSFLSTHPHELRNQELVPDSQTQWDTMELDGAVFGQARAESNPYNAQSWPNSPAYPDFSAGPSNQDLSFSFPDHSLYSSDRRNINETLDGHLLPPSLTSQKRNMAPWNPILAGPAQPHPPFNDNEHLHPPLISLNVPGQASHSFPDQRGVQIDSNDATGLTELDDSIFGSPQRPYRDAVNQESIYTPSTVPSDYETQDQDLYPDMAEGGWPASDMDDFSFEADSSLTLDASEDLFPMNASPQAPAFFGELMPINSSMPGQSQIPLAGIANQFPNLPQPINVPNHDPWGNRFQAQRPVPMIRTRPAVFAADPLGQTKSSIVDEDNSSSKLHGDVSGSFPPTQGHFPFHGSVPISKRRPNAHSYRKSVSGRKRGSSLSSNPSYGSTNLPSVPEGLESPSLIDQPVLEAHEMTSSPLTRSLSNTSRSRRAHPGNGMRKPLDDNKRKQKSERRRTGNKCGRCRLSKVACDQGVPCDKCQKAKGKPECFHAEWLRHVLHASCDGAFHRALPNGGLIDRSIPIAKVLRFLASLSQKYNIRVKTMSQSSYVINLKEFLQQISKRNLQKVEVSLREFFSEEKDRAIANSEALLKVVDQGQTLTPAERLFLWADMPSRNDYMLVSLDNTAQANATQMQKYIPGAVILNRLLLRAVEILAHAWLQKQCNEMGQTHPKVDVPQLYQHLGKTSCALRRRYHWCVVNDPSFRSPRDGQPATSTILGTVIRILYFWTCSIRDKNPEKDSPGSNPMRNLLLVDERPIQDPFPQDDTDMGFKTWLQHGQLILQQAGFVSDLSSPAMLFSHSQPVLPAGPSSFFL